MFKNTKDQIQAAAIHRAHVKSQIARWKKTVKDHLAQRSDMLRSGAGIDAIAECQAKINEAKTQVASWTRTGRTPWLLALVAIPLGYTLPSALVDSLVKYPGAAELRYALSSGLARSIHVDPLGFYISAAAVALGAYSYFMHLRREAENDYSGRVKILGGAAGAKAILAGTLLGLFGAGLTALDYASHFGALGALRSQAQLFANKVESDRLGLALPAEDSCLNAAKEAIGKPYLLSYIGAVGAPASSEGAEPGVALFLPGRPVKGAYGVDYKVGGASSSIVVYGGRRLATPTRADVGIGQGFDIMDEPSSARGRLWLSKAPYSIGGARYNFWRGWTYTQQDLDTASALSSVLESGQGGMGVAISAVEPDASDAGAYPYAFVSDDGKAQTKTMRGVVGKMTLSDGKTSITVPAICQRSMADQTPSFAYIPAQRAPAVIATMAKFSPHFHLIP